MNGTRLLSLAHLSLGFALAMLVSGCAVPADSGGPSGTGAAAASPAGAAQPGATPGTQSTTQPATQRLRGRYTHMADTGSFVDCRTGQRLIVAIEGDNAALESAYLKTRQAPGIPVLATVDGRIESRVFMEGPARPMLIVESFVAAQGGYGCDGPIAQSPLQNTYWKFLSVRGSPVTVAQSEPYLVLASQDKRVSGSTGCNRMIGGYSVDGDRLNLSGVGGTMMMCPEGMEQERAILDVLGEVRRWRVYGDRLDLLGASGDVALAQLEARQMR